MIEVDVQLASLCVNQNCTGGKIWHSGEVTAFGQDCKVLRKVKKKKKKGGFESCIRSYSVLSSLFCLFRVIISNYLDSFLFKKKKIQIH